VSHTLPDDATAQLARAALDNLPHPVLIYDDASVLYANDAAIAALGGRDLSELVGLSVANFILPDLADVSNARRSYVMDQGVALSNLMVKIRLLTGESVAIRVDIRPISFDGRTAALATLTQR